MTTQPSPQRTTRPPRRVAPPARVQRQPKQMVKTTYDDGQGRQWVVLVPIGHEDEAARGIVVGPPDVSELGLPDAVALALHQQLFNRRLITRHDLAGRAMEVVSALQAAYRVDANKVMNLYKEDARGQ